MKKITIMMLFFIGVTLNAQTFFSEDFETDVIDSAPSTMTALNEDACSINNPTLFVNETWTIKTDSDPQGKFASSQSWTVPSCTVDDWLISTVMDLSSAPANTDLSWLGKSYEGPTYPETYEVLISTTGSSVASFTTTLTTVTNEIETWTSHTINLGAYVGNSTVYIAFRLISTDQSQCFIDDILVATPPSADLAMISLDLTEPIFAIPYLVNSMNFNVYCDAATTEPVSITVHNNGTVAVTSFSASYENGSTSATETFTIPALASGASTQVTFAVPANIDTFGGYYMNAWVDMTGDNSNENDTALTTFMVTAPADTITTSTDYYTSFEQWPSGPQDLTSGWWTYENANDDAAEFYVNYWGSGTDQTTDGDFSLGINGDNATASVGADDWAFSPCIYFDQTKTYNVSFKVRSGKNGINIINENLDFHLCSDDNSASTVQSIGTIISDDTLMITKSFTFSPSSTGLFNVGLHKNTIGTSWWLWVDEFTIAEAPPVNELEMVSLDLTEPVFAIPYLTNPMNFNVYCDAAATETVAITVKNNGSTSITSFSGSYDIGTIITETFTIAPLAPGASTQVTFSTDADIDVFGGYYIYAWVEIAGDILTSNDTSFTTLMVTAPADTITTTTDYYTSFEQWTTGPQDLTSGWWTYENANDDAAEFQVVFWGSGSEQITDGDFSLGIYGDNGTAAAGADDWAFSPCIYFDQAETYTVTFQARSGFDGTDILDENLDFHLCSDDNSSSTVQSIGNTVVNDTLMGSYSFTFSPSSTGLFNVGLHKNTATLSWWLWVDEFTITMDESNQPGDCEDLYFSEYVEGSSNNKCIEIFNPTNTAIDLATDAYSFNKYSNGSSTATTTNLTGVVPAGGTFIICNTSSAANFLALADMTSNNIADFNGDDALELTKNSGAIVLDIFGQIGFDPGSSWSGASCSTANSTLVRNSNIQIGDINGTDVFDLDLEWSCYSSNDDSHLGWHDNTCNAPVCNEFIVTNAIIGDTCARNTGAIDITVTGGYGTNEYSWTNSETTEDLMGLTMGSYSITITDELMCDTTILYDVSSIGVTPILTSSSTSVTNCSVPDGTATVSVSSANAMPYTYSWNDATSQTTAIANSLPAGNYIATITDGWGCSATVNETVTNSTGFSAVLDLAIDVSCFGGNDGVINTSVIGGNSPFIYVWSDSPTPTSIGDRTDLEAGSYTIAITDANTCTFTLGPIIIGEPDVLVATVTASNNVTCNGGTDGSIMVDVAGGNGGNTFMWSNGGGNVEDATNLSANSYTLTVTDSKNCVATTSVTTISEPTSIVVVLDDQNDVTCNSGSDGNIFISATGGTGSYTYDWDNAPDVEDAENVGVGSYQVTVMDDNNCIEQSSIFTISEPSVISIVIDDQNDISCNGELDGNIFISATGGTGMLTYDWDNAPDFEDAENIGAGTYQLTVSDALNCTEMSTVIIISEPDAISIAFDGSTNVSCKSGSDGSISANVTGGTGTMDVSWTNSTSTSLNPTGLPVNDYLLTVTDDNNCSLTSAMISISEPATSLSVTASSTNENAAGNNGTATATATGGTPDYTYDWNDSNNQTNATATNLAGGSYECVVTDANGCSFTVEIVVKTTIAINEISLNDFSIFPNPTSGTFTVQFETLENLDIEISLINTIGKELFTSSYSVNGTFSKQFDFNDLSTGIYFLEISNEESKTVSKITISK